MERFFVFLENMRAKPEHTRRSFAIGVSLGITLLTLGIWVIFILPRTISTASQDSKSIPLPSPTDTTAQNTEQAPQDFGTMWQQMQAKYGNGSANAAQQGNTQGNTGSNTNTNSNVPGASNDGTTADQASNPTVPKNYNPDLPVLPDDVQTPSYPTY